MDGERAGELMQRLRDQCGTLAGTRYGNYEVAFNDDFAYTDPVNGATAAQQGIRILFEGGSRIVLRLSGTGTVGATLRVYLEQLETAPDVLDQDPQAALSDMIAAADEIAGISRRTGRSGPRPRGRRGRSCGRSGGGGCRRRGPRSAPASRRAGCAG